MAEVLITLGIIGIIAAITIPMIIAKYQDKVLESQNKKAQSILANGFKLMMAHEEVTEFGYTEIMGCTSKECVQEKIRKVFAVLAEIKDDSQFVPAMYKFSNGNEQQVWQNNEELFYSFITVDGMFFGIKTFIEGERSLTIIADINGSKNPNRGGKDLCQFTMSDSGVIISQCSAMSNYAPVSGDEDTEAGDDVEVPPEDNEACRKPPSGWDNCHPLGMLSIFGTGKRTCGLCKRGFKLVNEGRDWAGNNYGYCVPNGCN